MLIWDLASTIIHSHSFSGAFRVFSGSSLHSTYTFNAHQQIHERMYEGEIIHQHSEYLQQGDIRKIVPATFNHALFHLDAPSVTILARTHGEVHYGYQWRFDRPCIKIDTNIDNSPSLNLAKRALDVLAQSDAKATIAMLSDNLSKLHVLHAYELFRYSRVVHDIWQDPEDYERVLQALQKRCGDLANKMADAHLIKYDQEILLQVRAQIKDPDMRFFLALVANVPERDVVFRLLRERLPQEDHEEKVVEWFSELFKNEIFEYNVQGESAQIVLRAILRGLTFDEIIEEFEKTFDADDVQENLETLKEIYQTMVNFGPVRLLRKPEAS